MKNPILKIIGIIFGLSLVMAKSTEAREVAIAMTTGQSELILTNPSTVSVNYDISCFKTDGSGTIIALTNQTIAPNAQTKHTASIPDSGLCAGSTAPQSSHTQADGSPYYQCNGTNNFANANNACGVGNSFCFPNVISANFNCSGNGFWVANDTNAVQFRIGCAAFAAVTAGNQVVINALSNTGQARRDSAASACAHFNASLVAETDATRGSVCCSSPETPSVCKVTINTTDTNAFLASPSFTGGASF